MALAYRFPSIVEIFHAHLQTRQKPHPPGLRSASVSDPAQFGQAQQRFAVGLPRVCCRTPVRAMLAGR
jgi:hypothetical protein